MPDSAKDIDWNGYLEYCNRQGIIGVVFDCVQRAGLRIPLSILFEWLSYSETIKAKNLAINKRILQTAACFKNKGHSSVIMKGQANGLMYPKPELRSPGDIDIWVDGEREDIIKLVLSFAPEAHYSIHHVKLPIFKDVSVEVHYRPIYMTNWFADKKLQRYISGEEKRQFANVVKFGDSEIGCLTDDFNVVYQMLHMFHHFFETRNNFKQFVDYYYLLKKVSTNLTNYKDIAEKFRELGVLKYASGVMWIMNEQLGLDKTLLPIEPSEKEGWLILKESYYFGTWSTNKLRSVIEQFAANFRILSHYPKEVLISPLFLVWHQWWKIKMKIKIKSNNKI